MSWSVNFADSVEEDLRWFDRKTRRHIAEEAIARLADNPLAETRNMKTLRPNAIAQRELRLSGKYRVLFNVDEGNNQVLVVVVGEKEREKLIVRGEEFDLHYEDNSSD